MNEQDDKSFHDWVRQSLNTYRPGYDPQDWAKLQRTVKRKRWWRNGFLSSGAMVLAGLLGWFFVPTQPVNLLTSHPATKMHKEAGHTGFNKKVVPVHQQVALAGLATYTGKGKTHSDRNISRTNLFQSIDRPTFKYLTFIAPKTNIGRLNTTLSEQIQPLTSVGFSAEETAIKQQMTTGEFGTDSTSYRVLARNLRQWSKSVIVCDLTSSMYPYTTQLFTLLKQYTNHSSIQGIVFFTDCDSLGQQTYAGGPPGRMFVTRERNVEATLSLLVKAARNTVHNEDDAENDIEALLVAQKEFPEANHLILVADNISTVKDMARLHNVNKPVHVMLCGTTGSDLALAFQQDYYTIASQTNGSLHTLEDDFSPKTISSASTLKVGTRYYRYKARKKQFKLTPFTHRPRRYLKFIWL